MHLQRLRALCALLRILYAGHRCPKRNDCISAISLSDLTLMLPTERQALRNELIVTAPHAAAGRRRRPHSYQWVDEVKNVLGITLSCAAIAVLTSGCINQVAKTNLSSTAPLGTSASLDVGYGENTSSGGLAQSAALAPRASALVPAVPEPSSEKVRYLGSAPHICSPSGFGRKSTCFLRS